MDETDRNGLFDLLHVTRASIGDAVEYLEDPDLTPLAMEAWQDPRIHDEFNALETAIGSREYDKEFDRAGLSGVQLRFKLTAIFRRREEVDRALNERGAADKAGWLGKVRRLIAKLLGTIDPVLESLKAATGGIGEILVEFKKVVEKWLD